MPSLRVGPEVDLHYYDDDFTEPWRAGPAMLLQHGFSRSGKFWYNWVPSLAHEFRILRPHNVLKELHSSTPSLF